MFNPDFYPTPRKIIEMMIAVQDIEGKNFLEPNVGSGDIVDYLNENQANEVLGCELDEKLRVIARSKCQLIDHDFLQVRSDKVSHIHHIVMNPPFSADEKHILHAWDIAPAGCQISALCNLATLENPHTSSRKQLVQIVKENGGYENLGDCFSDGERKTGVLVALIQIVKPNNPYNEEFKDFFLDDDPAEEQMNGIMGYNVVRDLVNRYVECVKIYDQQLETAVHLNKMCGEFFNADMTKLSMSVSRNSIPLKREQFKKEMQKDGWNYIFEKMNMKKYATQSLKEDINKFVETQQAIPFTMKNIYHMLEVVIGTTGSRMDKAIEVVFDKLTKHYDENRHNVEGWKTNSHYMLNRKFIINNMCEQDKYSKGSSKINCGYGSSFELIEDMVKAVCYITGENYDKFADLKQTIGWEYRTFVSGMYSDCLGNEAALNQARKEAYESGKEFRFEKGVPSYGDLFDWTFFTVRAYKKGTMHFEFKDAKVWGLFNQRVAKIKGYPLFEATNKQKEENRAAAPRQHASVSVKPVVLATIKI